MAMTCSETQSSRLLRKTAHLFKSDTQAAWANGITSSAGWDLQPLGTDAYLAQRPTLDTLGQPGAKARPFALRPAIRLG